MKLSKKQTEVIKLMRAGTFIHWVDGIDAHCFLSHNFSCKLSVTTFFKLEDLKLIEGDEHRSKFTLTELGKTCELN